MPDPSQLAGADGRAAPGHAAAAAGRRAGPGPAHGLRAGAGGVTESAKDREARNKKRKRERQARKKARKKKKR